MFSPRLSSRIEVRHHFYHTDSCEVEKKYLKVLKVINKHKGGREGEGAKYLQQDDEGL